MRHVAPETASLQLLGDIHQFIEQSRGQLAVAVNNALTMLYWYIGHRIRTEVLGSERATYGEQIVSAVGRQLNWMQIKTLIYIDDFYIDLLLYNRGLKRLVAIELKLGDFKVADKAKWSCTCAGWRNTSKNPAKRRPWVSSCAAWCLLLRNDQQLSRLVG